MPSSSQIIISAIMIINVDFGSAIYKSVLESGAKIESRLAPPFLDSLLNDFFNKHVWTCIIPDKSSLWYTQGMVFFRYMCKGWKLLVQEKDDWCKGIHLEMENFFLDRDPTLKRSAYYSAMFEEVDGIKVIVLSLQIDQFVDTQMYQCKGDGTRIVIMERLLIFLLMAPHRPSYYL